MRTIDRPRLLELLPDVVRCRVTLVVAPLGSGKSTLLHQWMLALQPLADTMLISWGLEHNHPTAMRSAIARSAADVLPALQWVPGDAASGADLASFSAALAPNARRRAEVPLVIVLDDVHVLQDPAVLGMLGAAIELLPDDVRFVIAANAPMPLLLARLRLHDAVLEVGASELAFTEREIAGVVGDVRAPEVLERTDGWASAVVAAEAADASRTLQHYVREELTRGLPPHVRSMLLESAVLEVIDVASSDAVRDSDDSLECLEELGRRGRLPLRRGHEWRQPPMVREALLEVLAEESPERFDALRARRSQLESTSTALSSRELEVLELLDGEATISGIADKLSISYHTARAHVRSIYTKLERGSRAGAIRRARDLGLLGD